MCILAMCCHSQSVTSKLFVQWKKNTPYHRTNPTQITCYLQYSSQENPVQHKSRCHERFVMYCCAWELQWSEEERKCKKTRGPTCKWHLCCSFVCWHPGLLRGRGSAILIWFCSSHDACKALELIRECRALIRISRCPWKCPSPSQSGSEMIIHWLECLAAAWHTWGYW